MRGERGKVLPCSGRGRSGEGTNFSLTKKKKHTGPREHSTRGFLSRPCWGKGPNDKKPTKQVPAAPGWHPRARSGCGRPRRHGANQRKVAREVYGQPDSKGQETRDVVLVGFNFCFNCFLSTAAPWRTRQRFLHYSTAPGSREGAREGTPRGLFGFSSPSPGWGWTRGSKRVGGLHLSRL